MDAGLFSSESPLSFVAIVVSLAVIPFLFLALTSFIKLHIVFGVLRNALGAGGVPSAAITAMLSIVLSLHIMQPVISEVGTQVLAEMEVYEKSGSLLSVGFLKNTYTTVKSPVESFLRKHSNLRERIFFAQFHQERNQSKPGSMPVATGEGLKALSCPTADESSCIYPGESLASLVPAFVISEIHEAFAIGFLVFLPFLVVDLIVANLLVGMGMMMVSPVTISLPFKIILFVLCDGWFLLCRSLMMGYS